MRDLMLMKKNNKLNKNKQIRSKNNLIIFNNYLKINKF